MTRPGREPRPTVWEADTLTTKLTRQGPRTFDIVYTDINMTYIRV